MKIAILTLALGMVVGCTSQHDASGNASTILVFRGTVTAIDNSPVARSTHNWLVTMHIDQIEQGQFRGRDFNFRVHSPTKSGLTSNGTYRVESRLTQDGYVVDEFQWNK